MQIKPALSLKEISQLLNAEFAGDADALVTGINEIHMVRKGDITFVDHPKYYQKALQSKASFVLINARIDSPADKSLVFSEDPFRDFVYLIRKFNPFIPADSMVSDLASVGEGTVIQPGAFVGHNVTIGENCVIHSNVSIYDGCTIGNDVIIHANSVIGADAFYFQKRPEGTRKLVSGGSVIIHDHVEIGALCTVDRGVSGNTVIGEYTKLDNHIQIGHDTVVGKNCLFASAVIIAGVTTIEDDVILWGQVAINKDLTIGKGAVVLATSAVGKNLEGNKVYFGSPAEEARIKWKQLALTRKLPEIFEKLEKMP